MYYVKFKTSLLIQLITSFYYSYSTGNPFSSLLINDVTQLFLLRLANKRSILNLKESVRYKHEDSKVDYSIGECCFDRMKETSMDRGAGCKHQRGAPQGLREGSMLHRASLRLL